MTKLIGILARLHPVKGHEILIDAVSNILDDDNEVHVLITGEASELPELNNKIKKLNMEKMYTLLVLLTNLMIFLIQ